MSGQGKLLAVQMQTEPPTLLELLGHTFFFSNVLAGPNHHFHEYKQFIEGVGKESTYTTTGSETVDDVASKVRLHKALARMQLTMLRTLDPLAVFDLTPVSMSW